MTLQGFNEARRRLGFAIERGQECIAIRTSENHALVLIQKTARTFIGEIASREPSNGHSLPDDALG